MSSLAGPKRRRVVATACLIVPFGAVGADTSWTGTAADPYWDLAANWSAGPPLAATTRALLGAFDTTLRSGSFMADTVQGTGTLTVTGGSLAIAGTGSTLGTLDMRAGSLGGPGDLTVGTLRWSGGSIGAYPSNGLPLTVTGSATISGNVSLGDRTSGAPPLRLNGTTTWLDGASTIAMGYGTIENHGVFHDVAATGNHTLGGYQTGLFNQGTYEKTGAATTTMAALGNGGALWVREGLLRVVGSAGSGWSNAGTFNVAAGARHEVDMFRGSASNSGTVNVDGRLAFRLIGTGTSGTGQWNVGTGGVLSFDAGWGTAPWLMPFRLDGGSFTNAGRLQFIGANMQMTLAPAVQLSGPGIVEVLEGASLDYQRGALDIGGLRLGPAVVLQDSSGFYGAVVNAMKVAGALTVGLLDWGDGSIEAGGPVTVNGPATLTDNIDMTILASEAPGKRMNVPFRFNGGVTWDGNADIYGSGSMAIAAGTVFEDRNTRGTFDAVSGPRPTRIAVASVDNQGIYLKSGAGSTVIASAFANAGTVRVLPGGPLTFAGPLDNRGTLEVVGGRMVVFGPLAQASDGVLTGGRYVMRDGRIVLNLGTNGPGTGPATIWQNRADITLEGPAAKLTTTWLGTEYDALSGLVSNAGTLTLRNGAALETNVAGFYLNNEGVVAIEQARLSVGAFLQSAVDGVTVATWVDGTLQAGRMDFTGGTLGAGGDGRIGSALLDGAAVSFTSGLLLDVDIAGIGSVDLVTTHGTANLGGTLVVDFTGAVTPGTYRVLVADGGVSGAFDALRSDLGPQYEVTALYGGTYVDLNVAAVPEPATAALWFAGLGLLGAAARRRRA